MDTLSGGYQAIWKADAPGEGSGDAIIAVTGKEATDAADAVTECGGGRSGVEKIHEGDMHAGGASAASDAARQQYKRGDAEEQSAKPGKSELAEELMNGIGEEIAGSFQYVVELGAQNAGQAGNGDKRFGVGGRVLRDLTAAKIGAEKEKGGEHGAGDHQAEGGNGERAQMQKRNHGGASIAEDRRR